MRITTQQKRERIISINNKNQDRFNSNLITGHQAIRNNARLTKLLGLLK